MRPLEDVRIIAIEQYGAGPFGSLHLADLGADVIKIEDPSSGGDVGRYVVPLQDGEDSLFFEAFNRNKRSISLDLSTSGGRRVFEDLVRNSDAVYSNLRGDVPSKLGITYEALKHLNPKIVCCSLSGFGMSGPRSAQPGYDYLLQGIAGWMDLTGEPSGPPTKSGLSVVDYSGGLVAAIALLSGLHAARRDGVGMDCDVSLFDTAISMLTYPAAWALNSDFVPERTHHSAHPSIVPFQAFPSQDGWLVVACAKEKFWSRLAAAVGRPELAMDARFDSFATRLANRETLTDILEAAFRSDTTMSWIEKLTAAGVPCGPVNTVREALADPHTVARDMLVQTEHPRFGTIVQVATAARVGSLLTARGRAPARDEDGPEILSNLLGYPETQIRELRETGAFGAHSSAVSPAVTETGDADV
ncbi:CaiB/BaiF CoA transferase family protein [Cryobacterium ruanii]|uniref:CoA transferase n=1 Tax=Cryobacterium ruanii TaxID=1259197 RepID=A0A4R9AQ51_9MICO|nr:CoA transferase [Cryobacterium ruanii]TFD67744.1 CoA transferase [Cryobacterium ruanii]